MRDLGVDAIWLTPFYPSPGVDNGYDVADYVEVDPLFGMLEEFDALVVEATGAPWLPIPGEWTKLTVERQADHSSSFLALYRSAIALRPQLEGDVTWRATPPGTLVFERGEVVRAVSVDGSPLDPRPARSSSRPRTRRGSGARHVNVKVPGTFTFAARQSCRASQSPTTCM